MLDIYHLMIALETDLISHVLSGIVHICVIMGSLQNYLLTRVCVDGAVGPEAGERERVDGVGAVDTLDHCPPSLHHSARLPRDTLPR